MHTYIVNVTAKPGHNDQVARFYRDMEPLYEGTKGFHGRKIFQAKTGTMAEAVYRIYTAEELAQHAEPPHEDPGTQFIIIEQWESIDDRMHFSKNLAGGRSKNLIPHLGPQHSHEFYEDISVG
jgi:heme-degrading monooxygenase HmoA